MTCLVYAVLHIAERMISVIVFPHIWETRLVDSDTLNNNHLKHKSKYSIYSVNDCLIQAIKRNY